MSNIGPAVKVGITAVAAAIAGYWAFSLLAKGGCAGEPDQFQVHGYLRDATLLVEKSRVQISGLNVGHIVSRELNVRPPRDKLVAQKRFAKVTIALNKDVTLYSNAVMYKRSASLLGEYYIAIDPGTYEWVDSKGRRHVGEVIRKGGEIRTVVEAATPQELVQEVSELMPQIRRISEDVQDFIRGPLMSIGTSIQESIAENRQSVRDILTNVDGIVADVRNVTEGSDRDVRRIIEDVRAITESVRAMVGEGRGNKFIEEVKSDMARLGDAIEKLDRTMGHVEGVAGGLDSGEGTVGRLLKDDTLVNEIEEVVHETGSFIKSVVGLQTIVGLRSEYNFLAGSIKTYLTVELRPRPDKFYLIELIDDPRGQRRMMTDIVRSDDPSKPVITREERVVISDAFRMSFQFGKRIGAFTFRFGVKESTGGLGTDIHLLDDRLHITTDLFDFQANIFPRLKATAAWEFFRRLYVVGGIDDAFNDRPRDGTGGGRDYFVGGQIRFNDEDLRQLLLFGGSALGSAGQ